MSFEYNGNAPFQDSFILPYYDGQGVLQEYSTLASGSVTAPQEFTPPVAVDLGQETMFGLMLMYITALWGKVASQGAGTYNTKPGVIGTGSGTVAVSN